MLRVGSDVGLMDGNTQRRTSTTGRQTLVTTPMLISPGQLIITPDSAGVNELARYSLSTPPAAGVPQLKGKHGQVYIVRRRGQTRNPTPLAIKRQNPKNVNDMAFREIRISQQLQRLHLPNFLEVVGHAKVFANHLDRIPFASPTGIARPSQPTVAYMLFQGKENPQFLHSIMEYGGSETLHSRKVLTKEELRRFAFQLVFALHKAQKKYDFVHGDLHLKNMMLKPHADKLVYEDGGYVWEMAGPVVKIIDFGLSRLKLETGEVLCNEKVTGRNHYYDFETIASCLNKLKVQEWLTGKPKMAVDEPEHAQWHSLRKKLLRGPQAGGFSRTEELLMHDFFKSLRLEAKAKKVLPPVPAFSSGPTAIKAPLAPVLAPASTLKRAASAPVPAIVVQPKTAAVAAPALILSLSLSATSDNELLASPAAALAAVAASPLVFAPHPHPPISVASAIVHPPQLPARVSAPVVAPAPKIPPKRKPAAVAAPAARRQKTDSSLSQFLPTSSSLPLLSLTTASLPQHAAVSVSKRKLVTQSANTVPLRHRKEDPNAPLPAKRSAALTASARVAAMSVTEATISSARRVASPRRVHKRAKPAAVAVVVVDTAASKRARTQLQKQVLQRGL